MKSCTRCGEILDLDEFYWVSRKLGTKRGQCKSCMSEIKAEQRDPDWKPSCSRCGKTRDRVGMGRRLCDECFNKDYEKENRRENGSHRARLKPCKVCGSIRIRADHTHGAVLCPICRSVPQHRRNRLKNLFNMKPKEWLLLLSSQQERCAICHKKPRKGFHLDHQHKEPLIIRGALCNSCNTLLGMARDDPTRLRRAANYLDNPPAQILFPGRVALEEANRKREKFRHWKR